MGDYTSELCGGTHVCRSGQIGAFLILGESSVAAGVRRFECLTGEEAINHIQSERRLLTQLGGTLKARPEELLERVGRLQARIKELEKGGGRGQDADVASLAKSAVEKNGVKLAAAQVEAADPKALRQIGDELKDRLGSRALIGLAAASAEGKAMLLVMVGSDLAGQFKAGKIVAQMAAVVGGKGGGRDDMAQAGGPEADQIPGALEILKQIVG
jgi:alanyl-tRNA synthetase